jgi:hypothetical protein
VGWRIGTARREKAAGAMSEGSEGVPIADLIGQVDDAITVAAWRLGIDADTGYTEGYERELAREVHEGIPEGRRGEVLAWLVGGAVWGITVGAVGMLDECDEGSYAVIDEIAARLVGAIGAQDRADYVLRHLITHEISEREDTGRVLGGATVSGEEMAGG